MGSAACGGDDPTRPAGTSDAGTSDGGTSDGGTSAIDAGATGAAKGEACVDNAGCADPAAVCRKGNLCTGPIDALAFQLECVREAPEACPGLVCIGLVDNLQDKTGICSLPCSDDAECGVNAACVALTAAQSYCLHTCATDPDCQNGFACVDDPGGRGKACLVTPR